MASNAPGGIRNSREPGREHLDGMAPWVNYGYMSTNDAGKPCRGRPRCSRRIRNCPQPRSPSEPVILGRDEAESLRLADLEGLYQEAAARSMGVSRSTFARILTSARQKTARAVAEGLAIRVEGGPVHGDTEGERTMKIAAPSREGLIDPHFGHCKEYLVFTLTDGVLVEEGTIPSPEGCGCKSDIARVLAEKGITHMVAGNMGDGAMNVLASHGIKVARGALGNTREAVKAFAEGRLKDSGLGCAAHEDGHSCDHH